jgi:hypothetical protein
MHESEEQDDSEDKDDSEEQQALPAALPRALPAAACLLLQRALATSGTVLLLVTRARPFASCG